MDGFLGLYIPNLTIVQNPHAHYANCGNHYGMECAMYRPCYVLWNFGLPPIPSDSPYPSQWTENTSAFEAGMFHDTFYHNLAGEPTTIDLKFQLYFKTFWITHDKAKQIKGCQDKAFKPGVKLKWTTPTACRVVDQTQPSKQKPPSVPNYFIKK